MDKKYTLYLSESLDKKLQEAAERLSCSKSDALTIAIRLVFILSHYEDVGLSLDGKIVYIRIK
jgi:hypothetical protein